MTVKEAIEKSLPAIEELEQNLSTVEYADDVGTLEKVATRLLLLDIDSILRRCNAYVNKAQP